MSDYALLLVPEKGSGNDGCTVVKVESRHVSKVPGQKSKEIAFDTGLDPTLYPDNVTIAGTLCKLISQGREYQMARDRVCLLVGELDALVSDLKTSHVPPLADGTVEIMLCDVIERIREIGRCVHFDIVHGEAD